MDTEQFIHQDWQDGAPAIDAIERLQAIGYDPKDAEQIVFEWIESDLNQGRSAR